MALAAVLGVAGVCCTIFGIMLIVAVPGIVRDQVTKVGASVGGAAGPGRAGRVSPTAAPPPVVEGVRLGPAVPVRM